MTIVTPSFNQGEFIEETIRSVLLQGYPDLEYLVLDGGSTDDSTEIIRKYSKWLTFWVSERDRGQSAAINRGLRMGTGQYATWINSDDMLCKDALRTLPPRCAAAEKVVYLGDCVNIDARGNTLFVHRGRVRSFEDLIRVPSVWRKGGYICQPEVVFPLQLALEVGALDESNHLTMDYEFWGRLLLAGATIQYTGVPFGIFRHHPAQKTLQFCVKQTESMLDAATILLERDGQLSPEQKRELIDDLERYRKAYPREQWKHSGRLARLGLPPFLATPLRRLRRVMQERAGRLWSAPARPL
jgi:glycosyltransferase involved in cell wall biosynthesis